MSKTIAKVLAEKLLIIYTRCKLPNYAKIYEASPEGFTKERIINKEPEDSLFQLVIVTVYDRSPFIRWAGGFESIWGLGTSKESLPKILRTAKLFTIDSVLDLTEKEIGNLLATCSFHGHHIASYGITKYPKTFIQVANSVNSFLSDIRSARTASDIKKFHSHLYNIHGIGDTIASKLVMYTLRELPYFGSSIDPRELYPAVKPILKEYHNANLVKELKHRYGDNIVEEVSKELKSLGDPIAIDALYYVERDERKLKKCLLQLTIDKADANDKDREMRKKLKNLPLKPGTVLHGRIRNLSEFDKTGWLRREIHVNKDINKIYPKVDGEIILVDTQCEVYQSLFTEPATSSTVCLGRPENLKPWYVAHNYPLKTIGNDRDVYFKYTGCACVFWIYSSGEWNKSLVES
jgi:hypothetical protein